MTKRRSPTRDERQATAYLAIVRNGKPIVGYEEAKGLTPKEIIALFESRVDWHHNIEHAIGGTMHPTNLEPIPPADHKKIPSKKRIAKSNRIEAEHEEFRRRILAKHGLEPTTEAPKQKPKAKIKSAGFLGWKKFDGTPVRRQRDV